MADANALGKSQSGLGQRDAARLRGRRFFLRPRDCLRQKARQLGLLLAMGMRVLLLLAIGWVMKLIEPLFTVLGNEISGKDLILIIGGLFLLGKATHEIHQKLEGDSTVSDKKVVASFSGVIVQIMLIDVVFSLDSVITAVGMAEHLGVMISAVVVSVIFMMVCAKPVGDFVERHPTVKMLALSFLLLIGLTLGFVASLVFHAVASAGALIDLSRGATLAGAIAPGTADRPAPPARFYACWRWCCSF